MRVLSLQHSMNEQSVRWNVSSVGRVMGEFPGVRVGIDSSRRLPFRIPAARTAQRNSGAVVSEFGR